MSETYKLTYFNMRGRGEPIRLLFALANVPYEDVRVKGEDWPTMKSGTPWGQLPILEIRGQDGKTITIAQTLTIMRHLARKFKLAGANEFEMTKCEELADAGNDFSLEWIKYWFEKDEAKKAEAKKPLVETVIPKYLGKFESIQGENGGNWFVGPSVTWLDLWIANFLEALEMTVDPKLLDTYPNLKKVKNSFYGIPSIKAWVDKRPPPP